MDRDQATSSRRARLNDVARRAGVSLGTVSNVINNPQKVAPATRTRVFDAMQDLSFSLNGVASALARGNTSTVGLVVIDLSNSLFVDIARSVQHGARDLGLYLQLSTSEDDFALQDQQMRVLVQSRARGLLVAPLSDPVESIRQARVQGCPVVVLNYDTGTDQVCQVVVDNEQAGRLAAEHLLGLGRSRIAFIGGHEEWQPVERRLHGARAVISAAAGAELMEVHTQSLDPAEGRRVGAELAALPASSRPDSIIAVTDVLASTVIEELLSAGLRVPEDIAVMGCDHNSAAWGGPVPLTSVAMRGEDLGTAGLQLLAEEMSGGPHHHQHRVLQPYLVQRESTRGRR